MSTTRFKICGLTRLEDAQLATELGAWALGVILWPGSVRACDQAEAGRIAAQLRRRAEVVGVFVNQPLDEVCGLVDALRLTMVQLHGDEDPSFCTEVARRTGAKVIKAARVKSGADVQALDRFKTDFHLLDAYTPGQYGGTGETFEWELAHRRVVDTPLILSGGLHADNVADAIAAVAPFAVDVASGTEAAPGIKDERKLRAFADAVLATNAVEPTEEEVSA